jgi:acylphosphatase
MASKRFVVSGRVQGVGFRYFVVREAESLGLSGWVRNLPTGEVEVVVGGEQALVELLESRLWRGPPHARVAQVDATDAEPPTWKEFRVLPSRW